MDKWLFFYFKHQRSSSVACFRLHAWCCTSCDGTTNHPYIASVSVIDYWYSAVQTVIMSLLSSYRTSWPKLKLWCRSVMLTVPVIIKLSCHMHPKLHQKCFNCLFLHKQRTKRRDGQTGGNVRLTEAGINVENLLPDIPSQSVRLCKDQIKALLLIYTHNSPSKTI